MKPIVKQFQDDKALMQEVKTQADNGVKKENLYVMSHDDDRTDRVAGNVDANEVGMSEESFRTAVGNIFRKKGDELRAKFQDLGFDQSEADELEEKLDHGNILLLIEQG